MGKFGTWTKVKTRLPGDHWDGHQFLVTAYDPGDNTLGVYATEYDIGKRWDVECLWAIENIGLEVTAWMEFPDPVK